MSIFRLLSPDEIDKYIESKEVRKITGSMAASGEEMTFEGHNEPPFDKPVEEESKFSADHQAEIIPIGKLKKEEEDKEEQKQEPEQKEELSPESKAQAKKVAQTASTAEKSELESIGVLSASSLRNIEEERLKKELENKESTTAFLIKERIKMRQSKKRLIEQHAYKSYQVNAAQEFYDTEEELDEDENNDSSTKGILVNKMQY